MSRGSLALVLHAHLPYVRHPEHEQFLEEHWFYEAMIESYLPLLDALRRMLDDGVRFRLTVSLSPTLLAMMRDALLLARFRHRLENLLELCDRELARRGARASERGLAYFYRARLRRLRVRFERDCRGDLAGAFASLQREGALEILCCPATHGFLPYLAVSRPAVRAQVAVGVAEYRRHFGCDPRGIWLPECAYYPGLDEVLAEFGILYFIVETHGFRNANPPPRHGTLEPLLTPSGVAVFGRDVDSAKQVWSSKEGYPGDPWYREFYRDIGHLRPEPYIRRYLPVGIRFDTGLKYHRVTGPTEDKRYYVRSRALERARVHAAHFVASREVQLRAARGRAPVVVAPYDAELFGHWWFEGPDWLEAVLRLSQGRVRTLTLAEYLAEHPPRQASSLSFSSWGEHGYGEVWLNPQTDWIYPKLHRMAVAMTELARIERPSPLERRGLNQAARELLLAQSSDWPFLIRRGGAPSYAKARFEQHCANFGLLERGVRRRRVPRAELEQMERQFCLFPGLDYRVYA